MEDVHALMALVLRGPDAAAAAAVAEFGGDINTWNKYGATVLSEAVYYQRPKTIVALAARGDCDPHCVFRTNTPLHIACGRNDTKTAAVLLAHFPMIQIDARNTAGWTALHLAAYWETDCLALLLDAGADPTALTFEGETPAQLSDNYGYGRYVDLLTAAEAWYTGTRRAWITNCLQRVFVK